MNAPSPFTHVAWIRGINVGGNNVVRMAELRERLDARGLGPVQTYIQSGNVLLRSGGQHSEAVAAAVGEVLADDFAVTTPVVAVPVDGLAEVVAAAPAGFGSDADAYRYDVVFLRPSLAVEDALAVAEARAGVDEVAAGPGALYFRRFKELATKSYLPRLISTPQYKDMTIRNWKTTTAVLGLARA